MRTIQYLLGDVTAWLWCALLGHNWVHHPHSGTIWCSDCGKVRS